MERVWGLIGALIFGAGCGTVLGYMVGGVPRLPFVDWRLDIYSPLPLLVPVVMIVVGAAIAQWDRIVDALHAVPLGRRRRPPVANLRQISWRKARPLKPPPDISKNIYVGKALLLSDDDCDAADAPGFVYGRLAGHYYAPERFPRDVVLSDIVYCLTDYSIANHADLLGDTEKIEDVFEALTVFNTQDAIPPIQVLHDQLLGIKADRGYEASFNLTNAEIDQCRVADRDVVSALEPLEKNMADYWRAHSDIVIVPEGEIDRIVEALVAKTPDKKMANAWEREARRLSFDFY